VEIACSVIGSCAAITASATATPLFAVADLSALIVETDVDESYATQIRAGMPAVLQLTGETGTLAGTVSFVAPVVDAETGGLAVKIAFAEPQQAPVGLTVTANIVVDRQEAAISAPRSAIVDAGSKTLAADLSKGHPGHGFIVGHPGSIIYQVNEEHGSIRIPADDPGFTLGEHVEIIPNHVCPAVNLHDEMLIIRDGMVVDAWKIAARGKVK